MIQPLMHTPEKNIISIVWWEQHGLWNQAEPGWVRVVHSNWVISGTIMGIIAHNVKESCEDLIS